MTLIEGIGDEVTHFFIALFVVVLVTLAWWTTNISEQRHVRTVLLLERRRRLTNHTETVTIAEGTIVSSVSEENPVTENATSLEPSSSAPRPPETNTSEEEVSKTDTETGREPERGEEQNIIETMDADACVLRQRRLAFYDNFNNERQAEGPQPSAPAPDAQQNSTNADDVPDSTDHIVMEHNYAERSGDPSTCSSSGTQQKSDERKGDHLSADKTGITIKLKYINDDLKLVDGRLEENLGDFKRSVRSPTRRRQILGETAIPSPARNGISNLNNNNQNRDWDLGNFLFAFISFILLAAWYFRYVYAHLYTVTATVGLFLITGIFTIVLVGMYFPDNEHLPNPTIHIARSALSLSSEKKRESVRELLKTVIFIFNFF
ncbi:hypothetical protein NQ318_017491 [Aromia moschata]|uniref:Transmembrane and ubiquitin-like domain-containing protein 1 n=1 Tax=Aromia moschata TaxID=1265417 RepID=A0AAV8Z379_9CUCU|nr:hypothetical protein NQ318_017491 [Aromia moschata]